MYRIGISTAGMAMVCLLLSPSPQVVWSLQSATIVSDGIHKSFKDKLKDAGRGNPVDTDEIEDEIAEAVQRQIELFVAQAKLAADKKTKATAGKAARSIAFVESLETILSYELRNEPISDMESRAIRETLDELDVRIGWDYSIIAGAIPANKTAVRIRLPKLHACHGCKKALESALNSTEEFGSAVVDLDTLTAQFLADTDCDVEGKLKEIARGGVQQLADWKLVRK